MQSRLAPALFSARPTCFRRKMQMHRAQQNLFWGTGRYVTWTNKAVFVVGRIFFSLSAAFPCWTRSVFPSGT